MMGVIVSSPWHWDPRQSSSAIFVDAPSEGFNGQKEAEHQIFLASLNKEPFALGTPTTLRARMPLCCGDGHYAQGVEDENRRHNPVASLDMLFEGCGRNSRVSWDGFHRINKAGSRSFELNGTARTCLH